jgi:hypothetical protein
MIVGRYHGHIIGGKTAGLARKLGEVVQEEVEPQSEGAFILFLFYFGTIGT